MPKGRTVTASFYRNDVLRKLKKKTAQSATRKQALDSFASCMTMHLFTKHAFRPSFMSLRRLKSSHTLHILQTCTLRLLEPRHEISNNVVYATSKGSDQPAHTRSLIRAFANRLNILCILSY